MLKLIVCGNWHQFNNWITEDKEHGKNAIFINNIENLMGRDREKVEIIKYGTWWENEEAIEAVENWLGIKL